MRRKILIAVILWMSVATLPAGIGQTSANQEDRIPDFSYCGYRGGGVSIPDIGAAVTLKPRNRGDDTERIQSAIDTVANKETDRDGFRGAVVLKSGTYRVRGSLRIQASGVVLRGMGQQGDGTIIVATGTRKRALITIGGGKPGREIDGSRRAIADKRVPVGARSLRLSSTDGLAAGDPVVVFRPGTKKWIDALGTTDLGWKPRTYDMAYERRILAIDGSRITIDAPIVCAIESRFGGGSVYRTTPDGRISGVGVEKLRLVSDYKKGREIGRAHV